MDSLPSSAKVTKTSKEYDWLSAVSTLAPLQRVQNAAARLVFELGARQHCYTQPTPVALAPRTLAYPVQTVLPIALSLSWKLPSVPEEHGF